MQIWHGTNDTTLRYPNFGEQIKQWTNVHGLSQTPIVHRHAAVRLDPHPLRRHRHHGAGRGDQHRQDVGHNLPLSGQAAMAIAFFGLDNQPPTTPPPTPPPRPRRRPPAADPTTPPPTTPPPTAAAGRRRLPGHLHRQRLEHRPDRRPSRSPTPAAPTINGWALVFTLPSGQTITSGWNATYSPTSGQVTARNVSYNGAHRARTRRPASASRPPTPATPARPPSFTLNGSACTIV